MTAAVLYRPDALEEAADLARQRGQAFRYQGVDPRIGASCDRLAAADVSAWSDVGDGADALITRAVLDAEPLLELAGRAEKLRVVVDHFVHVERLASVTWPKPLDVLIEVAVGPGRFGGRPGRDAVDLARAVENQPALSLGGLAAEVRSSGMADSLLQTREQIVDAGIACDFVSVRCPAQTAGELPSGFEVRHDAGASVSTVVTVVGRPALELAVIDVGYEMGWEAKETVSVELPSARVASTARVRHVEPGRTLLTLADDAYDVVIGDRMIVTAVPVCPLGQLPVDVSPDFAG